jgi:hypothetical protein
MSERDRYAVRIAAAIFPISLGLVAFFARTEDPAGSIGVGISMAFVAAAGVVLGADVLERLSRPRPAGGVLPGATELVNRFKVTAIYPRREDAMPHIRQAVLEQAAQGRGRILMSGVSLREFFHPSHAAPQFLRELEDKLKAPNCGVELLLAALDPNSDEGKRRVALEGAYLKNDIPEVVEWIKTHFSGCTGRVLIGLHSVRPALFAVVTNKEAFAQRYISVPPWRPGSTLYRKGECYGDFAPLLRYSSDSDDYIIVEAEVLDMLANDCDPQGTQPPTWLKDWCR